MFQSSLIYLITYDTPENYASNSGPDLDRPVFRPDWGQSPQSCILSGFACNPDLVSSAAALQHKKGNPSLV